MGDWCAIHGKHHKSKAHDQIPPRWWKQFHWQRSVQLHLEKKQQNKITVLLEVSQKIAVFSSHSRTHRRNMFSSWDVGHVLKPHNRREVVFHRGWSFKLTSFFYCREGRRTRPTVFFTPMDPCCIVEDEEIRLVVLAFAVTYAASSQQSLPFIKAVTTDVNPILPIWCTRNFPLFCRGFYVTDLWFTSFFIRVWST